MAVKIRLARGGSKKRPYYRIVVADIRAPRDGKYIERVGSYNPLLPKDHEDRIKLDIDRIKEWLSKGAKPTDRVARFLDAEGILKKESQEIILKKQFQKEPEEAKEEAPAEEAPEEAKEEAQQQKLKKAPAEEAKEEAPAEEAKEEAPAEEAKEEAPAEAKEAPVEEAKEEAPAEEAEAPAEEAKEEAPQEEAPAEEEKNKLDNKIYFFIFSKPVTSDCIGNNLSLFIKIK